MKNVYLKFRYLSAPLLLLLSLTAIFKFEVIISLTSFMSPDKQITEFMLLLLRILVISLGSVGLFLLFYERIFEIILKLDLWINSIPDKKFTQFLLTVGFGLRFLIVLLLPLHLWADYESYDDLGWQWATKGGYYNGEYLTAYWPPGYPFFLSRLYLLFGHNPEIAVYLNIIFSLSILFLTYLIIKIIWTEKIARWGAMLLLFSPSQLLFCNLLASELMFTSLLLLSIWLALIKTTNNNKIWLSPLLSGVVLGLAILTRSIALPVIILLVIYLLSDFKKIKINLLKSSLLIVGCLIVIFPWMNRNVEAVGDFTINTNSGINLYMGNQPSSGMGYNTPLADQFDVNDPRQEVWIDSVTTAEAIKYIKEEPLSFLKRGVLKLGFFLAVDIDALDFYLLEATSSKNYFVLTIAILTESYYLIVLLLAILGITLVFFKSPEIRTRGGYFLLAIMFYWFFVHFVYYGMGRYHFPIVFIFCSLAAVFINYRLSCQVKNK